MANQKKFFGAFATKKGFDPLHAHNWYSVSTVDIKLEKVNNKMYTKNGFGSNTT